MDEKSRAGLHWLRLWARSEITSFKRRRKYLAAPGSDIATPDRMRLQALFDLENAAKKLLEHHDDTK